VRHLVVITSRAESEAIEILCGHLRREGYTVSCVHPRDERSIEVSASAPLGLLDFAGGGPIEGGVQYAFGVGAQTIWIGLTGHGLRWTPLLRSVVWKTCWSSVDLDEPIQLLLDALGLAANHARLAPSPEQDEASSPTAAPAFGEFVGDCAAMTSMYGRVVRIARTDASVLIAGETGTGKELVARTLHDRSARKAKPFVAVNCGALPTHLIASELFGHERGAFTGAAAQRIGRIEQADGGTLFLDEIGDLPADAQTYLLRALQEGVVERVGGTRPITVDVRIIAATHVDLEGAVSAGRFRLDLFHRLKVLEVHVPPLRERGRDICALAEHFLETFRPEAGRRIRGFAPDALQALMLHGWPGNVRELANRVRQAAVMGESSLVSADDLGLAPTGGDTSASLEAMRERAEIEAIRTALIRSGRNFSRASKALGISRMTLYRLIQKHQTALRDVTGPLATRMVELPAPPRLAYN